MSKHRFLMVTDVTNTDTGIRVAIPIKRIIQIKECKNNEDYFARIQYYDADNQPTTVWTKEFFYDIMTGCHTFEL